MRPGRRVLASLLALASLGLPALGPLAPVSAGALLLGVRDAKAADLAQPGADAFKARLVQNLAITTRARIALAAAAKRKAPPKGLSAEQRRAFDDQTRWLGEATSRFSSLEARMQATLAKTKASPSELAQLNLEFGALRDGTQSELARFDALGRACKERQAAAASVLRSTG